VVEGTVEEEGVKEGVKEAPALDGGGESGAEGESAEPDAAEQSAVDAAERPAVEPAAVEPAAVEPAAVEPVGDLAADGERDAGDGDRRKAPGAQRGER
jgi:hypothetical protein